MTNATDNREDSLIERTRTWLFDIVDELVDDPGDADVSAIESGTTAIFVVKTSVGDTGKIIGKNGRTADAIRCILQSIAAKNKCRFVLDIANSQQISRAAAQNGDQPKRRRSNGDR